MSLNYDLTKVKDLEAIKTKEAWPVTEALIFETMVVGIGNIKNEPEAVEFKVRSDFWRKLDNQKLFTLEEIKARIGLTTNVFPRVSWSAFRNRVADNWFRENVRENERETE